MDYNDQDGNNEGLYGARNENSVLFSLDSLNSMDKDTGAPNGGMNPSGDASGLINLSTLSAMSQGSNDEEQPIAMESMVFNQVVTKKKKRNIILIIAAFVLVIGAAAVAGYLIYQSGQEEKAKLAQEQAEQKKIEEAKQAELEKKIQEQEAAIAAAEAESKRRAADNERVEAEMAKLRDRQLAAEEEDVKANNARPSGKKADTAKKAPSAGAEAVATGKAESKPPSAAEVRAALEACNKKAQKCAKNGNLVVQMSINSSGSAKNVKAVSGSFIGTPTEKCILTVVEKHSFPTFSGAAIPAKYNFKL